MKRGNIESVKRKVHIALVFVSVVLGVGLYFLFRYILFGGNAVKVYPGGLMSKGLVPNFVYAVAVSIALIYACLSLTVGRIIINRLSVNNSGAGSKKPSYMLAVLALFVALAWSLQRCRLYGQSAYHSRAERIQRAI